MKAAQTELERTKIRSPIDGVVIGRSIEEGQQVLWEVAPLAGEVEGHKTHQQEEV